MPTVADWKRHFVRRLKSLDGHLFVSENVGTHVGSIQSLVGILAEVCPPGSLERVESLVKDTVITVSDPEGPREMPTSAAAVHATVVRANEWLRQTRSGTVAGEDIRVIPREEVGDMIRAGNLVSGTLIWFAPREAIEGFQLALRRPLQSQKVKDLNFAMELAMRDARMLASLLRST